MLSSPRLSLLIALSALGGCDLDSSLSGEDGAGPGGGDPDGGDTGPDVPDWWDDEAGCINVDGHGSFETIQGAIDEAPEGTVVQVCAGTYNEAIVVEKAVTVAGADPSTTFLVPPAIDHAITLRGSGGAVQSFTVQAQRDGAFVDGASGAALRTITFFQPGNWGIEASDPTDLVIEGCAVNGGVYGGISISSGTASVTGSTVSGATGTGIYASNTAEVTITGSTIDGTLRASEDETDGYGIRADGATIHSTSNTISNSGWCAAGSFEGTLDIDGDTYTGGLCGVYSPWQDTTGATLEARNLSIQGATEQGIFWYSNLPVALDAVTISIEAGASCSQLYEDWGNKRRGTLYCGGTLVFAPDIAISNSTISGYENYGAWLVGIGTAPVAAVSASTFTDSGRYGLVIDGGNGSMEALLTGLTLQGMRDPEIPDPCSGYVNQSAALYNYTASVTLQDSIVTGNVGWGISNTRGSMTVTGNSFDGNGCSALINFEAVGDVGGNTFTRGTDMATVYDSSGAILVHDNTFVDNHASYTYSYLDEGSGVTYSYLYSGYGQDLVFYMSASAEVTGNTFTEGDYGIYAYDAPVLIQGNTWTGYERAAVTTAYGDPLDPPEIVDNVLDDLGGSAVYSAYGAAHVDGMTIGATRATSYEYHYLADGVEYASYSYESSSPVFDAYGYYYAYDDGTGTWVESGAPSTIEIEDVIVDSSYATLLEATESSAWISDVSVGAVGSSGSGYGLYASWSHYPSELVVEGLEIESVASTAVYVQGASAEEGLVSLADVAIGSVGGNGVEIGGLPAYSLSNVTLDAVGGIGLTSDGDYSYYDYWTSTSMSGTYAVEALVDGFVVAGAIGAGAVVSDGTLSMTGSSLSGGASDGLQTSDVEATVTGNAFTGNAGYGMTCTSVTLAACSGNDLSGNTTGTHSGCDDACGT